MMSWAGIAQVAAWLVAGIELVFGGIEVLCPQCAAKLVFGNKYVEPSHPIWLEPARNLGLYNCFLAVGLVLALISPFHGAQMTQFFVGCVAVAGIFGWVSVGFSAAFIVQLVFGLAAFMLLFCSH